MVRRNLRLGLAVAALVLAALALLGRRPVPGAPTAALPAGPPAAPPAPATQAAAPGPGVRGMSCALLSLARPGAGRLHGGRRAAWPSWPSSSRSSSASASWRAAGPGSWSTRRCAARCCSGRWRRTPPCSSCAPGRSSTPGASAGGRRPARPRGGARLPARPGGAPARRGRLAPVERLRHGHHGLRRRGPLVDPAGPMIVATLDARTRGAPCCRCRATSPRCRCPRLSPTSCRPGAFRTS